MKIGTLVASTILLAVLAACGDNETRAGTTTTLDSSASPTPTRIPARATVLAFCYSGRGNDAAGRRMFAQIRIEQGDGIAITGTYLVGPSIDAGKTYDIRGTLGDGKLDAVLTIAGKDVPMRGAVDDGEVVLANPQPEIVAKDYEVGCD